MSSARAHFGMCWLACGLLALAACTGDGSGDGRSPGGPGGAGSGAQGAIDANNDGKPDGPASPGVIDPNAPQGTIVCDSAPVTTRRLWRLTPAQYDNTIRDLLGIEGAWGAGFPADTVVAGFSNSGDALLVTPLLADKLRDAAEDIAARVPLAQLAPCATAAADDACLEQIARELGARVFRRPLTNDDVERYATLARSAGGFEPGARLLLTAMLQSPHFLYRSELGSSDGSGRFALSDHEIASELSYLLWQTMPDAALFEAADKAELHTVEQIRQQVDRMLGSERARPMVRAFVLEWLGLSSIDTVPKDPARFPELTAELRAALRGEVERFVDHVMFTLDGSPAALLTTPATFLDQALAEFYGVELTSPVDGIAEMDLRAQDRRGILTLGGTMLAHSRSNDSSPVHRGKLVRERLLCQALPPPPPGIVVQPPPLDANKTTRDRYAEHSQNQPCAGCHRLMDPIGLSFEHFDGIGRYRADDNGMAIDASGEIVESPSTDGAFDGSDELIDKLAGSEDVRGCYARQWLRFGYGLPQNEHSECITTRMLERYAGSDGSLAALIAILTEGESLRFRDAAPDEGSAGAPSAPQGGSSAPGDDASVPDPPEDDPQQPGDDTLAPGLVLEQTVNNDWGAGYCHTYQVRNDSNAPITWSVPLTVEGTMNQHWECMVTGNTGDVVFTGAPHNATLEPSTMAQFGFCVER